MINNFQWLEQLNTFKIPATKVLLLYSANLMQITKCINKCNHILV